MINLFTLFKTVLPDNSVQAGVIQTVTDSGCWVMLPSGAKIFVRGTGSVADHVFIRGGAIDGPAPNLTAVTITV